MERVRREGAGEVEGGGEGECKWHICGLGWVGDGNIGWAGCLDVVGRVVG